MDESFLTFECFFCNVNEADDLICRSHVKSHGCENTLFFVCIVESFVTTDICMGSNFRALESYRYSENSAMH